jgi:hypothetical protein
LFVGWDDLPNFVHGVDNERIGWHAGILLYVYQTKLERTEC